MTHGNENVDDRPAGLADKFWDTGTSSVRVKELSDSYNELTTSYTKKTEDITTQLDKDRLAKRPETAEKYDFKLPSSIETPPGYNLTMDEAHPLVGFWRQQAWSAGLDQAGFEAGVAEYVKAEIGRLPNIEEQQKKLGENGKDRFDRAHGYLKTIVNDDEFVRLGSLVTTADGIMVVEKMIDKVGVPFSQDGKPPPNTDPEDNTEIQPSFDNKTRRLMGEDGYQRSDPGAVKIVRDRWAKAYPGQQEPERNAPRRRP